MNNKDMNTIVSQHSTKNDAKCSKKEKMDRAVELVKKFPVTPNMFPPQGYQAWSTTK